MIGQAVFSAVGRFAGLTKPAQDASKALADVSAKAKDIEKAVPASGGQLGQGLQTLGTRIGEIGTQLQGTGRGISDVGGKLTKNITAPALGAFGVVTGLVGALGFKRLVGIDTARGQFKGLGFDADAVMEKVGEGVTNTALSMAEGASIAVSALSTNNVTLEELEAQIKRVANVSAAYGVEASHAGRLLNNVLVQNKVTWGSLSQMEANNIPIVTMLAEKYGVAGDKIMDMAQDGKISIEDLNEVLDKNAGAAAEEYSKTWEGIWANLKANIGKFGADVLGGIFPDMKNGLADILEVMKSDEAKQFAQDLGAALRDVADTLIDLTTRVVEFVKENPKVAEFALKFAAVAIALGPILSVMGKIVTTVGLLTKGVGGAVKGIGKVGSGLQWAFGKGAEGQASRFVRSFDTIRLRAGMAKDAVVSGGKAMGNAMVTGAKAVGNAAASIARGFWSIVTATGQAIAAGARWAAQMVVQAVKAAAQFAVQVARMVAGWVLMGVQSLIHAAKMAAAWLIAMGPIAIVIAAVVGLVALIIANWDTVKKYTLIAWEAVVGALKAAWDWIKDTAKAVFDWIVGVVSDAWDGIKKGVKSAWDAVLGVLKAAWEGIKSAIKWYFETYVTIIKGVWDAIKKAATTFWEGLKTGLSNAWDSIKNTAQRLWNGFKDVITRVWDAIRSFINERVEYWKRVLSNAWDAIRTTASNLWERIKSTITDKWDSLKKAIDTGISNLRNALSNAWDAIRSTALTLWENIKSAITGKWDSLKKAIDTGISNLKRALSNAWDSIKTTAGRMWDQVSDAVKKPIRTVLDVVVNKGLIAGYNWIAGKVGANKIDPIKIGFRDGGYTGRKRPNEIAGYVHGDEHVIKSPSRRKIEREQPGLLDYINKYGSLPEDHGRELPQYRRSQLPQGGPSDWLGGVKDWFDGKVTDLKAVGNRLLSNMPSLGNNMLGDMLRATATKLKDAVVKKIASIFGGDGFTGDGPALGGWRGMQAWIERQAGLGARVTSGFRPGAIAAGTGRASMHSLGRAIDIVGPNMRAIFQRIIQAYGVGRITELIYSPMGGQNIHRGSRYHPSAVTMRDHWDHVHWGMRLGGLVPGRGNGDRTPLMGEPGEFMVRRRAVRQAGVEALHALNAGKAAVVPIDFLRALSEREAGLVGSARHSVAPIGLASGWLRDVSSSTMQTGGNVITTHVYNPIGEPTEVSVNKRMQRLAAIGVL